MTMDSNFWIGFFGFLATLVFGVLSIYFFRSKKYLGNLTFISEQTIGLFDSIIKNFPQISITYNGDNINQQIVLLKGFIVNSGQIDIKEDMVEDALKLKLPESYKWLNVKIVDSTKGSKAILEIKSDNEIHFNLGLFRKNEFLRFEALVDVPSSTEENSSATETLNKELKFEHRIADTGKVEQRPMNLKLPNLKKTLGYKIITPAIMLIYLIMFLFVWLYRDIPANFYYFLREGQSVSVVSASPHIDKTVKLRNENGDDYKTISLQEFSDNIQKIEIRKMKYGHGFENFFSGNGFFWIVMIVFGLLFIYLTVVNVVNPIFEYRKIKRLRQSLNITQKEESGS